MKLSRFKLSASIRLRYSLASESILTGLGGAIAYNHLSIASVQGHFE
jgi:hypothetical protein